MATERTLLDNLFDRNTAPTVWWDLETFSRRNLKKCGAHVYAVDPSTGMLLLCFAVDNGEVQVWLPGDPRAVR